MPLWVKIQDPWDIEVVSVLRQNPTSGPVRVGEPETWRITWRNNGPDSTPFPPASPPVLSVDFSAGEFGTDRLQFNSIDNNSGDSQIIEPIAR